MKNIKRILIPVDFSETAEHAARQALELATALGSEVHLAHVYQLPMYAMPDGALLAGQDVSSHILEASKQALDRLAKGLSGGGVELHQHIVEGVPHTEIVRMARELDADLIVMGTHGRSGLGHLLLGSVAERVVRISDVPVMTVRMQKA